MTLAQIDALPAHLTQRGGSRDLIGREYLDVVKAAIANHPRSLQKAIGPSQVGHSCARRIGYELLGFEEINHRNDPPWKPTIGTAVHTWLEDAFMADNKGIGYGRWIVELTVAVGTIGGTEIRGHLDLYDRVTATIVDHKVVGPEQLRAYRAKGPGPQYRGQIMLYARGAIARGLPVDQVAIMFLPRQGELRDAFWYCEPYDEQVARDALARAEAIHTATTIGGRAALQLLPTADAYCTRCPFFLARSDDPSKGCPGDAGANANKVAQSALTLST